MHNGQTPMTLADKKEHPVLLGRGACCGGWISSSSREKKTKFQLQKLGFNQQTRGFVTSTVGFGSFLLWSDFRWYHLTNLLTLAGLAGSSVATAVRTPLTARDTLHQP